MKKNIRQAFASFFFMIANKLDTRDIHDLKAEIDRAGIKLTH